jgi:putative PEP-CTERM system histidine kinase
MDPRVTDVSFYGYALAVIAYGGYLAYLWRSGFAQRGDIAVSRVFVGAVGASALWAALSLAEPFSSKTAPAFAASAADLLRYGLWYGFLLLLLRPAPGGTAAVATQEPGLLRSAAAVLVAGAALTLAWRVWQGWYAGDESRLALASALALAVFGLLLIEQLLRNLSSDSLWNAKPVCFGLACAFAFDVYLFSEALLFGRFDPDAAAIRGGVHALAVPLLLVAARRSRDWVRSLQVSRTAAFYSATLLLAGAYLLFMSAIGYYVRYFGGDWGRALQLGLVFAAAVFLALLAFSGSLRARIRVFVNKNFFSYRYDYRQEWLRFTAMLSSTSSPQEVGVLVVKGLANMVECPGGSLWAKAGDPAGFEEVARWNAPAVPSAEPIDSPLANYLREQQWVIDLDEYKSSPRRYGQLALPMWMLGGANLWLVVPLLVGEQLLGFVTLLRPRTPMELNWEVRDLLKTASRQAAGFLAQMQAAEALLEARKFDAFNRMSAFVVHDLKNIVTQLTLMLKNAKRLAHNPEFQQDMLLTVESSLEKMRRLMLQLREGAAPPGGTRGVELEPIVRALQASVRAQGREVDIELKERLSTRGHEDRLERVLGHVVQNALDATPDGGRVWLLIERFSGQVRIEVGDTGVGMTEEFIRDRLFRPFNTTKGSGMGIGSFESAQYVRELGGSITVQSQVGHGTVVTILLPLFDAQATSDLHLSAAS